MSETIITGVPAPEPSVPADSSFWKNNLRDYGLLVSLLLIMAFFEIVTGGVLGATDYIRANNSVSALTFTTTKNLGKQELKAGADFRVIQLNTLQDGANTPVFSFAPTYTQGPTATAASSTAGAALATFLLGIPGGQAAPAPAFLECRPGSEGRPPPSCPDQS